MSDSRIKSSQRRCRGAESKGNYDEIARIFNFDIGREDACLSSVGINLTTRNMLVEGGGDLQGRPTVRGTGPSTPVGETRAGRQVGLGNRQRRYFLAPIR